MQIKHAAYCGSCGRSLGELSTCKDCGVATEIAGRRSAWGATIAVVATLTLAGGAVAVWRLNKPADAYGKQFYAAAHGGVISSSSIVVPMVNELLQPKSVLDIGCGIGEWLAAFKQLGVANVHGVDGPWVQKDQLVIDPSEFEAANIENQPLKSVKADLAMSLEVGEHLRTGTARKLVAALTDAAPVVLFSAAIPGQTGTDHINEQWPSFWHALFEERGYAVVDWIRPRIQHDERVAFYYRQNIVLYVKREHLGRFGLTPKVFSNGKGIDWVHISRRNPLLSRFY